jgi:hypothetical protein
MDKVPERAMGIEISQVFLMGFWINCAFRGDPDSDSGASGQGCIGMGVCQ